MELNYQLFIFVVFPENLLLLLWGQLARLSLFQPDIVA